MVPSAAERPAVAFHATTLLIFLAASATPTPLYRLYQENWGLSPLLLTVVFGIYAVSLLGALLTVGALSDHIGRRPVIFAALLIEAAAMAVFATAGSASALIAARALQGIATGIASTTVAAALLDHDHQRGPLINGLTPMFGMAAGSLAASALAAYAPWPMHLSYAILLVLFLLLAGLLWTMPESATRRPGAWASLVPKVVVPPQARKSLLLITPANIAAWALGGFYLSLMPSLVRAVTGYVSPLLGGLVVSLLMLSGASAVLSLRGRPGWTIVTVGMTAMIAGVGVMLAGTVQGALPLMMLGSVFAGFGFGAGFLGSLRVLMPLAGPGERAGLMAAFYVESYLAFCLAAVLAGFLARALGLTGAIELYGGGVIAFALIGLGAARFGARRGLGL